MVAERLARLLVPAATALLLVACGPSADEPTPEATPAAVEAPREVVRRVRVVTAESGTLASTRSTSVTIEPAQESQVAAGTTGRVEAVLVREGGVVAAGQPVVRLDAEALRLQVANARTSLESARVNLASAEQSSIEGQEQARVSLTSAEANLRLAEQQYAQSKALFEAGGLAQTALTQAEAGLEQARAGYQQAQNAVAQSGRSGSENLALLRLQVEGAQTQLAQAQSALDDAVITAPFAGEVADVMVEEGEFVAAGSPAFRLVSTERQLATFSVPPQDAALLTRQGTIHIPYGGLDYAAQIIRSAPVPGQSRLVNLTAEVYPSETRIPIGTVTQLDYPVELAQGVRLPAGSVQAGAGRSFVLVAEEGRAVRRDVRIVAEVGGEAVVQGVEVGTEVIFPLPADLRPGATITVMGGGVDGER